MWRVLALILCAVVSLSADTAAATTIADKNDVRGELDLRAASLVKVVARSGAVHLRVRWDTYGVWTVRDCRTAQEVNGACDVRARLDTRGRSASRATGRGIDYSVVWGPLACSVTDLATNVVVVRGTSYKGPRRAACTFRRGPLVIKKPIRWFAFTKWAKTDTAPRRTDDAPRSGWVS